MIYKHFKGNYYLRLPDTHGGASPDKKYINYLPLYFERGFRIFTRTTEDFFAVVNRSEFEYTGTRFTRGSLLQLLKKRIKCLFAM